MEILLHENYVKKSAQNISFEDVADYFIYMEIYLNIDTYFIYIIRSPASHQKRPPPPPLWPPPPPPPPPPEEEDV